MDDIFSLTISSFPVFCGFELLLTATPLWRPRWLVQPYMFITTGWKICQFCMWWYCFRTLCYTSRPASLNTFCIAGTHFDIKANWCDLSFYIQNKELGALMSSFVLVQYSSNSKRQRCVNMSIDRHSWLINAVNVICKKYIVQLKVSFFQWLFLFFL